MNVSNSKNTTAESDKIISIIIPAFNSTNTLKFTLSSLLKQKGDYITDITVIDSSDNGLMDGFIKDYKVHGIRFINSGVRVMPAVQRNIGAKASNGAVLLFLDADVILENDYIEKIYKSYKNGYLAGFGSVDIPSFQKKKIIPLAQYYIQLNEYLPAGKSRVKSFVCGCNNYCDRKIFDKIGGYPEIRASEDVLYGLNISRHTPIWFIPEATVAHIFRENWKGFADNQKLLGKYVARYRKEESQGIIFKKYMPIVLFPAFLGFKLLRIMPRIFSSGVVHTFRLILVFPIFFMGLVYWNIGFTEEALKKTDN